MRVQDIMTTSVLAVSPEAPVAEAASLMLTNRVSGLPVVDAARQLVGVITEGDFLRRGELGTCRKRSAWLEFLIGSGRQAQDYVVENGRRVDEIMTRDVIAIGPEAAIEDLVELMTAHHIKRVPVVEDGQLVGIVARADLMRALLTALPATASAAQDDARIRAAILAELEKQTWSGAIRVKVLHGVVTLTGTIFDERARAAAKVVAENVAGVKEVVDQIAWIEPMSGMCILPDDLKAR